MDKKEECSIFWCVGVIVFCILMLILLVKISLLNLEKSYRKAIQNPPKIEKIVDDIDERLMNFNEDMLFIYDQEQKGEYILYHVALNNKLYIFCYKLNKVNNANYYNWEFYSYKEI